MSSYDYTFKVVFLGNDAELKTSFTKRYCYNIFNPSEQLTIGVEFHVKTTELNGKKVKLQLWDISEEERFRFLLPTYCLGANAAFICFDITRPQSLDNIYEWASIVRQKAGKIPIGLVGMRGDEEKNRKISREYAIDIAKTLCMDFYGEVSAKTGQNVNVVFQILIETLLERIEGRRVAKNLKITPDVISKDKKESVFRFEPNPTDIIIDSEVLKDLDSVINKLMKKYEEWEFFTLFNKKEGDSKET